MKRIFGDYAYGDGPRDGCWWDETCDLPTRPVLETTLQADVAIIGGGFTGLSAALHLAEAGAQVVLLEAEYSGWGASGRNGGFCCLGGARASDDMIDKAVGQAGRIEYRRSEAAAVALVEDLLQKYSIDVDRHSRGETELAHRPRHMAGLQDHAKRVMQNYGVAAEVFGKSELQGRGMAGPFHGGLTIPLGFGLNPRKYLAGLAGAADAAGAAVYHDSAVTSLKRTGGGFALQTVRGAVSANQVIVATNGYSSDDLAGWLAGRYMPAQSNVLVTRPLTDAELAAAGWTTDQMAYDSRNLLHYFRLMPDRRFLFGMRGGLRTGPRAEAQARAAVRRDLEHMFPAWAQVESAHSWSGMVGLARNQMPFAGAVPNQPGLWAGLCYHGNGVAMGSFTGALLADLVLGRGADRVPRAMQRPLARFPFGAARRAIMPLAYAGFIMADL